MGTGGFSRRDLLHLGGKLVMTVGAAKIMVALPGCGGDDGGDHPSDAAPADVPSGGYATLDDCHAFGTYEYVYPSYPTQYYTYYYYHHYYVGAYGCPGYVYPHGSGLFCYPDENDFAPGYSYFCYVADYGSVDYPP
jgi:hypothetical protein